jgi:transportin-3
VLTQLCLAVALLALHMESWLTVVPDLISNLTTPPEQAAVKLPCLLELLTVLPEEVENFKVGIMPRRRQAFREMLKAAGQQVLQLLLQVCEQCRGQDAIMKRQLRCLSSWLRNAWLPSDQLAASPIMALAFASIASPELFECATDVLVDAVHFSHDHEEHQQLIGLIVPQVLQLVPMYEEGLRQEDDDTCRALCRIFTETGEQYLHLILRDPQQALPVVSAVLRGDHLQLLVHFVRGARGRRAHARAGAEGRGEAALRAGVRAARRLAAAARAAAGRQRHVERRRPRRLQALPLQRRRRAERRVQGHMG